MEKTLKFKNHSDQTKFSFTLFVQMGHSRKKKTVHKLSWIDTAILDRLGFPLTNEQGNTLITPIGYLIQKPEESASSAQTIQYLYDDEYFIRVEFQEEYIFPLFFHSFSLLLFIYLSFYIFF